MPSGELLGSCRFIVDEALLLVTSELSPLVHNTMRANHFAGDAWLVSVTAEWTRPSDPTLNDPAILLRVIEEKWQHFSARLGPDALPRVQVLREIRNQHAHGTVYTPDGANAVLDDAEWLLDAFDPDSARKVKDVRRRLERYASDVATADRLTAEIPALELELAADVNRIRDELELARTEEATEKDALRSIQARLDTAWSELVRARALIDSEERRELVLSKTDVAQWTAGVGLALGAVALYGPLVQPIATAVAIVLRRRRHAMGSTVTTAPSSDTVNARVSATLEQKVRELSRVCDQLLADERDTLSRLDALRGKAGTAVPSPMPRTPDEPRS